MAVLLKLLLGLTVEHSKWRQIDSCKVTALICFVKGSHDLDSYVSIFFKILALTVPEILQQNGGHICEICFHRSANTTWTLIYQRNPLFSYFIVLWQCQVNLDSSNSCHVTDDNCHRTFKLSNLLPWSSKYSFNYNSWKWHTHMIF